MGLVVRRVIDAGSRLEQVEDGRLFLRRRESRRIVVDAEFGHRRVEVDPPFLCGHADERAEQAFANGMQTKIRVDVAPGADDCAVLYDHDRRGADGARPFLSVGEPLGGPAGLGGRELVPGGAGIAGRGLPECDAHPGEGEQSHCGAKRPCGEVHVHGSRGARQKFGCQNAHDQAIAPLASLKRSFAHSTAGSKPEARRSATSLDSRFRSFTAAPVKVGFGSRLIESLPVCLARLGAAERKGI
jgi:hypothetical protein